MGFGPPLPSCNVSRRAGVFLLCWTPGTGASQSLGFLYEVGPFLQSVTLTVAQGAELGSSLPTTSVLSILCLRACKLKQGQSVSGSEDTEAEGSSTPRYKVPRNSGEAR